ncbi:hypothetical protein I4U23_029084 [Adineta vaga]|nr:hypothetical protein I4U23_029084 [Adineta vaga]
MAVDDSLPISQSSASSSSSLSSLTESRHRTQIATDNSSSFIPFFARLQQTTVFIPAHRSRTNLSTTPSSSLTTDIQSISNESKLSNPSSSNSISRERKRFESQQRFNPILNNPLLNHRREVPKPVRMNISTDSSQTIKLHQTTKPFKVRSNDKQTSTSSLLTQRIEPVTDRKVISEELPLIDKRKYDYITRWIHDVRLATYSSEQRCSKMKVSQKRLIHS